MGDAGLVAETACKNKKSKLKLKEIFLTLNKIATTSGNGSQDAKICFAVNLLKTCTPIEAKFLIRILVGQLRLGAGTMKILDSISIAYLGGKEKNPVLEDAYNLCPDIGLIAEIAARKGINGVRNISIKAGRPIKVMLASRVDSIGAIKDKMHTVQVEEKYDGERVQAHFDGKKITLFSRRLDDITAQFPDIVEGLRRAIKAKSYILEGECCAVDNHGNLEPFQKLMQRRRKHDVESYITKVPVTLFLFDALYLNGKSLVKSGLPERRNTLEKIIRKRTTIPKKSGKQTIKLARRVVTDDIDAVEEFFNDSLGRGCEGIIAKNYSKESTYQAGTRGWLWIKWKPEYSKTLRDTFDLVVVGAYMGRGKRSGKWGALLCAVYNDKTDTYETLCKLGSGFNDAELDKLNKRLGKWKSSIKPVNVSAHKGEKPDTWFKPSCVLEVLGAEITRSQTHTAAEKNGTGLALRFPRFIRWREDKDAEQATTSREVGNIAGKKKYNLG
jgi:DNA ligase I, ATP-dependent (dnl1)